MTFEIKTPFAHRLVRTLYERTFQFCYTWRMQALSVLFCFEITGTLLQHHLTRTPSWLVASVVALLQTLLFVFASRHIRNPTTPDWEARTNRWVRSTQILPLALACLVLAHFIHSGLPSVHVP